MPGFLGNATDMECRVFRMPRLGLYLWRASRNLQSTKHVKSIRWTRNFHTPSHASPGLSERERRNPKIRPSLDPTRRGLQGLLMGLATPRRVTYDDGCPGSKCSVVVHFLPDGRVCRSCLCRCSNVKPCLTACLAVRRLDGRGLGLTCVPKNTDPTSPKP